MKSPINQWVRPNIQKITPYSTARDEFEGTAEVLLDANENSLADIFDGRYSRYPDPHQRELKRDLATLKGVQSEQIFLGNGSDEAIDLLYRVFCQPAKDGVVFFGPTYGMYKVSAAVNEVDAIEWPLDADFDIPAPQETLSLIPKNTKILIFCSPNNPTGNQLNRDRLRAYCEQFNGIVVIDEAYIDFAPGESLIPWIDQLDNLVILQTFSKAWSIAALRLGVAYSTAEIIAYLNLIKPPYNINAVTQEKAKELIETAGLVSQSADRLIELRENLIKRLQNTSGVLHIYPSKANFLLVKFDKAPALFQHLLTKGIVIRNRCKEVENGLRITVGNQAQNELLCQQIENFYTL
ncbi:MAG TPA: histidinol-phosphate transaminase [Luteibaculaceae bacterium]|nr:histidinol-phosphate transaminase [Luteibaculaceae bacterium]